MWKKEHFDFYVFGGFRNWPNTRMFWVIPGFVFTVTKYTDKSIRFICNVGILFWEFAFSLDFYKYGKDSKD